MANRHYGEIGDVWKHLPLAEVLALERPLRYWESHAGSASYPLSHSWQRDYGIYYFLTNAWENPTLAVCDYFEILDSFWAPDGYPATYPGSPLIAMLQLGAGAQEYILCDTDAQSVADLRSKSQELGLTNVVRPVLDDGMATLWERSLTLSSEDARRTLVHIDPYEPFEVAGRSRLSAVDLCCNLAERGFQVVYWYGYETLKEQGWAWHLLCPRLRDVTTSLWCGDLSLVSLRDPALPPNPGIRGCGVLCANISPESIAACARLGAAMEVIYNGATLPGGRSGALVFASWPNVMEGVGFGGA
jgi:23S rRNA (adenine2030-N6)-methyltransferase